jgi:hypothetical protein
MSISIYGYNFFSFLLSPDIKLRQNIFTNKCSTYMRDIFNLEQVKKRQNISKNRKAKDML